MERQILPLVPLLRSLLLTQGLGRVEVSTPPLVMRGPAVTNRRPRLCQPAPSNRRPHHRLSQAPRSFSAIWRIPSLPPPSLVLSRGACVPVIRILQVSALSMYGKPPPASHATRPPHHRLVPPWRLQLPAALVPLSVLLVLPPSAALLQAPSRRPH
jgi:hypothetical protein